MFKTDQRYLLPTALSLIFFSVFILTWYSIDQSRKESLKLLKIQGKAFTEALAQASQSSIESESIYDILLHKRFNEIVLSLESNRNLLTRERLAAFINDHNLLNIIIYEKSTDSVKELLNGVEKFRLPVSIYEEIQNIFDFPESSYLLLLEQSESLFEASHYYITISYDLKRVYLIVSDALYFVEALKQSQFGYLAQNIARETGVEYIIYQSPEGIIFASRKPGELLAIESDPFLVDALQSDTIVNRMTEFQGTEVLELVRPFATKEFPFGLFRVGMSLNSYKAIMRGYNLQIISISGIISLLVLLIFLFSYNRARRKEISRELSEVKSVTDKLFNEINSGLAVINKSGRVTMANKSMEKILGQSNIEGMKWRDFQKYLGSKLPMDNYYYVVKLNDKPELYKGRVKPIVLKAGVVSGSVTDDKSLLVLKETVSALSEKIETISKGNGVSMEMLLEVTKQSYVARIDFLGVEINKKDMDYNRLELKCAKLEEELNDADVVIADLEGKTGVMQYVSIAKEFLQMKAGSLKGIENLGDSNPSDIPSDITEVLGVVNWVAVDPNIINEIVHYIKVFANKLPLKGK